MTVSDGSGPVLVAALLLLLPLLPLVDRLTVTVAIICLLCMGLADLATSTRLLVRILFRRESAVDVGKVGRLIIRVSIRCLVEAIRLQAVWAEAWKTAATRLLRRCLLDVECEPNILTVSGAAWVTRFAVSTTIMYGLLLTPRVLAKVDRLLAPPVVVVVVVILVLVEETAAVDPIVLSVDPETLEALEFRVMIGANALLGLVLNSMA